MNCIDSSNEKLKGGRISFSDIPQGLSLQLMPFLLPFLSTFILWWHCNGILMIGVCVLFSRQNTAIGILLFLLKRQYFTHIHTLYIKNYIFRGETIPGYLYNYLRNLYKHSVKCRHIYVVSLTLPFTFHPYKSTHCL